MKSNRLLLIAGVFGILIAAFATFFQKDSTISLIAFICGASLIWYYFELRKPKQ